MTDRSVEYRITITGPEADRDGLVHKLKKVEQEAERHGSVSVKLERVETTEDLEEHGGFD